MSDYALLDACSQWATRPDDERFSSLEDLHHACSMFRAQAAEKTVPLSTLRLEADNGHLALVGRGGQPAQFTHWSFGQACRTLGAPAAYLRTLPATLAAQNLNYGLARIPSDHEVQILARCPSDGQPTVHALTGERYSRIWNSDLTYRLKENFGNGGQWRVPPARPAYPGQSGARIATETDVLANHGGAFDIHVGDLIAPAGLYASDHDLFVFMVDDEHVIDDGTDGGLARGFFITNSEVGAASFSITRFLYRHVCGNHIIWGAKQVQQFRTRHVGDAEGRGFRELHFQLRSYLDESADTDRRLVVLAQGKILASSKDELLDTLFGRGLLTRKAASDAYDLVQPDNDGNPCSAWGIAQGVTRLSQLSPYADARTVLDRAASKILDLAF